MALEDILAEAEEPAKGLARDTLIAIADWIDREVRGKESLDGLSFPVAPPDSSVEVSGSTVEELLSRAKALNAHLEKRIEAKEAAWKVVEGVLLGLGQIALTIALGQVGGLLGKALGSASDEG
jgi:hypothetical protein